MHRRSPHPRRLPPARGLVGLLAVLALTTACGADPGADEASGADPDPETATAPADDDDAFPVTLEDGDREVEIAQRPERIVSLSPTATEVLFAIGAGDQVIAVDDQSDHPEGVPTTDLSGFQPNVEAIAAHDPDLVIAAGDPGDLVASLEALDVPILLHPSAATLEDAYAQIERTGVATGHVGDAAELVGRMQTEIDEIVAEVELPDEPLTYYHELDPTHYSVASSTFIGEIYGLLGMESIADAAEEQNGGYPQLSPEFIVEADPDLILLADAECCDVTPEQVAARPGWDTMTAVENDAIVVLDEDVASRWGPRVVELLRTLADAVAELEPVA